MKNLMETIKNCEGCARRRAKLKKMLGIDPTKMKPGEVRKVTLPNGQEAMVTAEIQKEPAYQVENVSKADQVIDAIKNIYDATETVNEKGERTLTLNAEDPQSIVSSLEAMFGNKSEPQMTETKISEDSARALITSLQGMGATQIK